MDDHVRLEGAMGLTSAGITLEAWIFNLATGDAKENILASRDPIAAREDAFIFRVRNDMGGVLEFGIGDGINEWGTASDVAVPADAWVHVAVTHDRATREVRFFLNGIPAGTHAATIDPSFAALPIWLSGDPFIGTTGRSFGGWIDDVRIWSLVRSPAQIENAFRAPLRGDETGLFVYWSLDDGPGQIALDHSSFGYDGMLGTSLEPDGGDPSWSLESPLAAD